MPRKLRENLKNISPHIRKRHRQKSMGRKRKVRIGYLMVAAALIGIMMPHGQARAEGCPDIRIVFARGSGGERWTSGDYLEFKGTIESKLATTNLSYDFIDLDYPAVGIGFDNLEVADTTLGAFFGGGEAYKFGESMWEGVDNLKKIAADKTCPNTKYVLGGYSQGAMVLLNSLSSFNSERVIYAATFGDPKIYLPEGEGIIPIACRGENLSDYRMYVPDCKAYKGILGAYIPYETEAYIGKIGTWCNKRDILCSSHLNISDHTKYASEGLYEDASRVIFDKITKAFGIENHISSPHDTAFLIDSTGSMADMIEKYKAEALRLATETLNSGGRVALYDYRDLSDPYTPVEHCNFETCTLEVFENELATIQADGGGDTPESLLSASFHTMTSLKWKYGATKSLVVLTDADFLSPDRDGMTFDEVVKVSKKIDPVNFYIITNSYYADNYSDLAAQTGGKVVTNFDELSLLTDYIMERHDSLPRVEEDDSAITLPTIKLKEVGPAGDSVRIKFETDGIRTIVALNDKILGVTEENEISIFGLDENVKNRISLIPLGEDIRGEGIEIELDGYGGDNNDSGNSTDILDIPKAPNTGRK